MKLSATFTYEGRNNYTASAMNDAFKHSNEECVEFWHAEFLPKHFQPGAAARYAYAPRAGQNEPSMIYAKRGLKVVRKGQVQHLINNPKYFWKKKRSGHGTQELVYTGQSERAVSTMKVTASSKQGTGSFPTLPRYFYQYRQNLRDGRTPIDKVNELVRLTPDEISELAKIHEKSTVSYLEKRTAQDHQIVTIAA